MENKDPSATRAGVPLYPETGAGEFKVKRPKPITAVKRKAPDAVPEAASVPADGELGLSPGVLGGDESTPSPHVSFQEGLAGISAAARAGSVGNMLADVKANIDRMEGLIRACNWTAAFALSEQCGDLWICIDETIESLQLETAEAQKFLA